MKAVNDKLEALKFGEEYKLGGAYFKKLKNYKDNPEEMWEALEIAQAKDFVKALPDGLESYVSQGGKNLSGGQKHRLAIARAIIKKADIYIFDDSISDRCVVISHFGFDLHSPNSCVYHVFF